MADAELEASEVLHSLLSVERVENKSLTTNVPAETDIDDSNILWHTPVQGMQSTFVHGDKIILQSDLATSYNQDQDKQLELIDVESTDMLDTDDEFIRVPKLDSNESNRDGQIVDNDDSSNEEIENSVEQVKSRFEYGCECSESCFKHLDPDSVFKHRLNVAELTKEEHDMYLMGLTMACLANRKQTYRNKERQRQRASYVYQGRRVCLDSFLYLENVTQYHLKRIRNHVMTHGVTPRVHGNMGKKPHNTFSLDMYKNAEHFVKEFLKAYSSDTTKPITLIGETKSSIYTKFKENGVHPDGKIMGFTTFRHFMQKQFPNVRFAQKIEHTTPAKGSIVREIISSTKKFKRNG